MGKKLAIWFLTIFLFAGFCSGKSPNFVLWQLPSQVNTIGNSYVFLMDNGKVVVMDGGVKEEEHYLRGFLAALGNEVEVWFVSHPHPDHIGALNEILKEPAGIIIRRICHSEFSPAFCALEPEYRETAVDFYKNLKRSGILVENLTEPGKTIQIDKTRFKILAVKNESIPVNPYNNSSMVIRVWDDVKSVLFLADAGEQAGELLLGGPYRKELDCDYLQMAHHGQKGVSRDFYRTVRFKACLWPSPSWVYHNDVGRGFNTHTYETVEIRNLVDSLGIKKDYVSCEGICKIR
ncbi:MAG: ComEC/Rec2 family competence protein [Mangrovibacterium sp.]